MSRFFLSLSSFMVLNQIQIYFVSRAFSPGCILILINCLYLQFLSPSVFSSVSSSCVYISTHVIAIEFWLFISCFTLVEALITHELCQTYFNLFLWNYQVFNMCVILIAYGIDGISHSLGYLLITYLLINSFILNYQLERLGIKLRLGRHYRYVQNNKTSIPQFRDREVQIIFALLKWISMLSEKLTVCVVRTNKNGLLLHL